MKEPVLAFVVAMAAILIYHDALRVGIGASQRSLPKTIPLLHRVLFMPAGMWGALSFLLAALFVPLYVLWRAPLKKIAVAYPGVRPTFVWAKTAVIAACGLLLIANAFYRSH